MSDWKKAKLDSIKMDFQLWMAKVEMLIMHRSDRIYIEDALSRAEHLRHEYEIEANKGE